MQRPIVGGVSPRLIGSCATAEPILWTYPTAIVPSLKLGISAVMLAIVQCYSAKERLKMVDCRPVGFGDGSMDRGTRAGRQVRSSVTSDFALVAARSGALFGLWCVSGSASL